MKGHLRYTYIIFCSINCHYSRIVQYNTVYHYQFKWKTYSVSKELGKCKSRKLLHWKKIEKYFKK